MSQPERTPWEKAKPTDSPSEVGWAGIGAFVVALLLSPLLGMPIVSTLLRRLLGMHFESAGCMVVLLMAAMSFLVPLISWLFLSARGRAGQGWALAGVLVSVLSWVLILFVVAMGGVGPRY